MQRAASPAPLCACHSQHSEARGPHTFVQVRRGAKGRLVREWVVCDPGLPGGCGISPAWVPQLQLHMLAAGCASALLMHR